MAWSELPTELIGQYRLERRMHERGGEREVRFLYRDRRPRLPVWRDGRLQVVRWGNGDRQSRYLPPTGWTWKESVDAGVWRHIGAVWVDIPATLGFERGVWYRIRQGIRGILVPDEQGVAVAYMVCVPATHYYQVMTKSMHMPLLIDQSL